MFRCFVFAGCDRSAGLAMAKNSFKLEHPLGLFVFPFFFKSLSLLNKVWIFCDNHVFFFNWFCDCCLELWKCVWDWWKGLFGFDSVCMFPFWVDGIEEGWLLFGWWLLMEIWASLGSFSVLDFLGFWSFVEFDLLMEVRWWDFDWWVFCLKKMRHGWSNWDD